MEKKRKGAKVRIALCVLILLAALIYALTGFITDLLWFKETGYVSVFFTELWTKIKLHLLMTMPPAAFVTAAVFVLIRPTYLLMVLIPLQ